MKKTFLTITLAAACVSAFAQGKINVLNDANHAVYYGTTLLADSALSGTLVSSAATPSGSTFVVDLYGYAGTAGGSLALLTTVPMSATVPGVFGPLNWNSTLPGGSASTFQVTVHDQLGIYSGQSSVFTMQPGGSIAYNSLVNPGGTTLSTWAAGTQAVPGGFGAIQVNAVPEPSSMVLAGLGAASLLMFRRRK